MLKLIPHGINMVQYEVFKLINGESMQLNSFDYQVIFPLYLYVWILFKELYFIFKKRYCGLKALYIKEVIISGEAD